MRTKGTKSTKSSFLYLICLFLRTKVKDVKQAEFFPLDVFYAYKSAAFFIRLCAFCTFYAKQTTFFLLDVFMRIKMSSLFAYVPFVRVRLKTPLIPLFTILLLPFLTEKWAKFFSPNFHQTWYFQLY